MIIVGLIIAKDDNNIAAVQFEIELYPFSTAVYTAHWFYSYKLYRKLSRCSEPTALLRPCRNFHACARSELQRWIDILGGITSSNNERLGAVSWATDFAVKVDMIQQRIINWREYSADLVKTRQCSNKHGVCPMRFDSLQHKSV